MVGTGGPEFFPDRLGISTLVEANGQHLLFDVGRGTAQNLYLSRINPKEIDKLFISHLHNDHIEGLPELWITPWFLLGRDHGFEMKGVLAKLTTPEQAAEIFRRTAPRMVVYTHIVAKDLPVKMIPEEIVARTRAAGYDGPLTVGEDRMVIEVADDIVVRAPQPIDDLPMLDSKNQTFP